MRDDMELALAQAVAETETEIFDAATDREPRTPDLDRDLEQVAGWDGRPLGSDEQIARTMGVRLDGITDRPLESAQELNEYQQAIKRADDLERENADLRTRFQPEMKSALETQREEARQRIMNAAVENPDALLGEIDRLQNAHMQLDAARVESALQSAAHEHGERFQAAYDRLQAVGRQEKAALGNSPTVTRIWSHSDPGRALIEWANSGMLPDARMTVAPFMPARAQPQPSRGSRAEPDGWNERGNPAWRQAEEEIWADAARG